MTPSAFTLALAALLTSQLPNTLAFKYYNTSQLAMNMGLPLEEHKLVTEGGYVITLHRIPGKSPSARPVLFVHGILGCSELWLLRARNKNMATVLADNGYDVWLANQRGNMYSHEHMVYSTKPDSLEYWNFSFDEIAIHDLPAMIDHILETTQQKNLYYVGHSMGTTVFMAMGAARPDYNKKVKLAALLAPVAFPIAHIKRPFIRSIIHNADGITALMYSRRNYEFLKRDFNMMRTIQDSCSSRYQRQACLLFLKYIFSANTNNLDLAEFAYVLSHIFAGTSVKTFHHLSKLLLPGGKFGQYDYGPVGNMKAYGSLQPPQYNVSQATTPIALIHSKDDPFVDHKSLGQLRRRLPNIVFDYQIPDPNFQHMDYLFGVTSRKLVTEKVLKLFSTF